MISEQEKELVFQEIDGVNTPAESARFRTLIASNPEAAAFFREHEELFGRLGRLAALPALDPSPNVKKRILNSVRAPLAGSRPARRHNPLFTIHLFEEVYMRNKLIVGGVVAACVVIYFAFLYPWPGESDVYGTIGGVKKYRSEQITDADVVVNNSRTPVDIIMAEGSEESKTLARTEDLFKSLTIQQAASLFQAAPIERQLTIFRSLTINKQEGIFRTASGSSQAEVFRSANPWDMIEIARTAPNDQIAWCGRA
jgi:hypothetical protein